MPIICVNLLKYSAFALNLFQIKNKSLTHHSFNTTSSLIYQSFTINLPYMFAKLLKYYMFTYNWSRIYVTLLNCHSFTTYLPLIHHWFESPYYDTTSFPIICVNSLVYTSFVTYLSLIHKSCVVKLSRPIIYHWLPLIYHLCTNHLHKL